MALHLNLRVVQYSILQSVLQLAMFSLRIHMVTLPTQTLARRNPEIIGQMYLNSQIACSYENYILQ